ncbi:MAG: hypothetical protein CMP59_03660 [Flavobacteriales bacterium]|nr:hypothetical protein [Flavobacteriales bacterium]
MSIKELAGRIFASLIYRRTNSWKSDAIATQKRTFESLIKMASNTAFGKDHDFKNINSYTDFQDRVPLRDYEGLKPYIERMVAGEEDILWPGKPTYLSKTSGTTSGAKYIPLTKESLPYHIKAARDAILHYVYHSGKSSFINGKMIFLQGSPELDKSKAIPTGRLSGIVAHYVPAYLQANRLPSFETNCIDDWEKKVDAIVDETIDQKMAVISGIPPWVQMYFERLIQKSGKQNIAEIFPDFSLFIYGGVNYKPYEGAMRKLIGKSVDSIELYPASEGFIAYQDNYKEEGMLLLLNSGIFYEFVPLDKLGKENPKRLTIEEVELGVNYLLILSTNAGLWGYNIGDTIKFVSLEPYRIIVSGRVKHYTSAFGEHVIAEEVEKAISYVIEKTNSEVGEFHLAPEVNPKDGELPYHEWLIEFNSAPSDLDAFTKLLNDKMCELNSYYRDLIEGKILQPLKLTAVPKGAFNDYMRSKGKLGGQNKLPRLANDRNLADELLKLI